MVVEVLVEVVEEDKVVVLVEGVEEGVAEEEDEVMEVG